jgi:putative secretion ATPase (PEP-CTERM system associated)
MYESHFGFSGAPFSLNADPAFFFGSSGHSNALSYLKFGVYQGEGFVVLTGEIGAGKTTLVRTLLEGLESEKIVAAQIVSTQLEPGDLLRSIALAFGIAPKSLSKAELIATIEAFLMLLATENRRALLIVDEAQNLDRAAVEELRMLSNFQLGSQALLQSFLVGQPELRTLVMSKPLEQFRQRVIASCHLGPMTRQETRAYIEHRLQQVGWTGNPSFDDDAVARIFHWSAGIPRRVNLLCNRLLLAAFLGGLSRLDAALVDSIGAEMSGEVGEGAATLRSDGATRLAVNDVAVGSAAAPAVHPAASRPPLAALTSPAGTASAAPARSVAARAAGFKPKASSASHPLGPLMVVAASPLDDVKTALLVQAWQPHKALSRPIRLRVGAPSRFEPNDAFCARLAGDAPVLWLAVDERNVGAYLGVTMKQFEAIVDEHRPGAVAVVGAADAALACALVAQRKGSRVAHLEAGVRAPPGSARDFMNGVLVDRLAAVHYPAEPSAYLNLVREGTQDSDVLSAGSLLVDALDVVLADPSASPPGQLETPSGRVDLAASASSYGLVLVDEASLTGDAAVDELLSSLDEISRDARLFWLRASGGSTMLGPDVLRAIGAHERIVLASPLDFPTWVMLLKGASFVVTDADDVRLLAGMLDVRCLWADAARPCAGSAPDAHRPAGGAAPAIAAHLFAWLTRHAAAAG